MPTRIAAALGVSALAALLAGSADAHEGHDHGAPAPPVSGTIAPRGEAVSEEFELVAVGRDGALTLYLDRFRTNEPVTGATLAVETPSGSVTATPEPAGGYRVAAPWADKPGHYDLIVTVTHEGTADVLLLDLTIPEPAVPAPAAASSARGAAEAVLHGLTERFARQDPLVVTAAALGFLLGLAVTVLVGRRRVPALALLALTATLLLGSTALAHEGEEHAASQGAALTAPAGAARSGSAPDLAQRLPDGTVFVPKPIQHLLTLRTALTERAAFQRTVQLPGRVIPDPNASGVVQSSVGGRLSPPSSGQFPRLGTAVKRGDVLATVTPPVQAVDVSDMRQRQGELDQQIAIVQRRVERFEKLANTGAVARTQLDDALAELSGLRDRRSALDSIRREPEALVAPVDGVVAGAAAVAGQMASPGAMVFQVIDPGRLWIEALSFDALAAAGDATARLADGRSLRLAYQGSGLSDRNQAIPVQFAIQGDTAGLRVGQFVTVLAATDSQQTGLALPRASIVRTGNGGEVVYEHTTPERFEARPVRVEPLDGERVLIAAGVEPGRRVVTQGAELLDQVR